MASDAVGAASIGWTEVLLRLATASGIGGALGLQREYDGQDAGFRTHMLVVLGSALFALVSVGAFDGFVTERAATNVAVDVTRIASYVAAGVGFIGGGAILKYGGQVSGITTAASLWSAAAIGVASGVGFWQAALVTGTITLIALAALEPVSAAVGRLGRRRHDTLVLDLDGDAQIDRVIAGVTERIVDPVRSLRYGRGPDDDGRITIEFWRSGRGHPLAADLRELGDIPGVAAVSTNSRV